MQSDALHGVLKNYPVIEEELQIISDSKSEETGRANGLGTQLSDFSVFFGLHLSYLLFPAVKERVGLLTALQA